MNIIRKCLVPILLCIPLLALSADAVNINTADKEVLMTIKGIGEKRAEAIIEYRKKNGPFKSVDQLAEIRGVGQVFVDANRNLLVVKDPK